MVKFQFSISKWKLQLPVSEQKIRVNVVISFILYFQVENVVKPFLLSDADYSKLMGVMLDNFNRGLGKETNATAAVKMFPTYVKAVPDGTG